jgi:hypothetical protein
MTRVVDPYPDDTINSLRAEVDKLREALEIFACECEATEMCPKPENCAHYNARVVLGGDT